MEVHHHPDLHHKRKHFKEYLLEFVMIFLAVTLGFFAESLREHINDRAKEKEYMHSLIDDLKYDTAQYQQAINTIDILKPVLDSSYTNVKEAGRFNYTLLGKWNYAIQETNVEYHPTLPTIEQMKSSGNLRLIENKELGKQIAQYEALVKGSIELANNDVHSALAEIYAMENAFCDYTNLRKVDFGDKMNLNDSAGNMYDMPIIEKDRLKQNKLANSFINYKLYNSGYRGTVEDAKRSAAALIQLINEAYDF